MPTPVATARQCLTQEAVRALDEAVAVAIRRGHAQTTSVHMVSSLLSLPSSALREACSRTRNNAYSTRVQFKALELCLGVSLDRLPSSPNRSDDEPPVSNSLMAAIKRSQANQRRQPENFNLYQQQQQSSCSSAPPVVKVELQNMILSILDDPAVSRVFAEAGFRSCDIKIAILRPVHQFFRYSRYKAPPLFLCNLGTDSELRRRSFSFPFLGYSGALDGEQNCKRISQVFLKNKQKNPMLVGVCAYDALRSFLEIIERRSQGAGLIPPELSGLSLICMETELSGYVNGDYDEDMVRLKFEEIRIRAEQCSGAGVVVNVGDLKVLGGDEVCGEALQGVIGGLAKLIKVHAGKLWVIGAVAQYEIYLKVLNLFPNIEKDWDLQLLTITSLGPFLGQSYPKSSLMESFVPFGGLFTTASDIKTPLSSSYPNASRCCLCNDKCRQEINALSNGGFTSSVADLYQHSSLPSWLQSTHRMDSMKAEDDNVVFNAKIAGLQRKWDSLCQQIHYNRTSNYHRDSRVPSIVGFEVAEERKDVVINKDRIVPYNEFPVSKESSPIGVLSNGNNVNLLSIFSETPSKSDDDHTSPTSVTSVTMDLGLHISSSSSPVKELDKSRIQSSSLNLHLQFDPNDFKNLYEALAERIGWQEEAVRVISQKIAQCRTMQRHYQWFHFTGPDNLGKKKIAIALSEILYGSTHNLICVDLSFQDGCTTSLFDIQFVNKYDVKLRGKNVVDYIAEKLADIPMSVVFLENVEKADLLVQHSLSQAAKTGKFSDSHGREVSISNAIFVTASDFTQGKRTDNYSEEDIFGVTGWPIHIQIGVDLGDDPKPILLNKRKTIGTIEKKEWLSSPEMAKRAHWASNPCLDLNQPANYDNETTNSTTSSPADSEPELVLENSSTWLQDFLTQADETVMFKPFGFGSLDKKMLKDIERCFHKSVGPECMLEIESKVMEQILAAACLTSNIKVQDWIQSVLCRGFVEAQENYSLTAHSVVKLVTSRYPEEHIPGVILPGKIIMN